MMQTGYVVMLAVIVLFTLWLTWVMYTTDIRRRDEDRRPAVYRRLFLSGGLGALVAVVLYETAVFLRWYDSSEGLRNFMHSWSLFFLPGAGGLGFIVGSFVGLLSKKWNR